MARTKKWVAGVLVFGLLATAPMAGAAEKVAMFSLRGPLSEAPSEELPLSVIFGGEAPTNMFDLVQSLRKARSDSDLAAVIFDIEGAALGMGQIQELRREFEALRAADKDVLIYAETLHPGTLLLGSSASRLVLLPTGEVVFHGIYAESSYYKNLLDKVHVEADIIHCGDFKSAGEPFYRTGPSKEAEEQTNKLLDSMFGQIIEDIAKSRKLTDEKVRELVDKGLFSAKEALDAQLVDKLQYRGEFIENVKKRYGKDVKVVRDYGAKKGPDLNLDSPFAIFGMFKEMMSGPKESAKPAVAVVYVEGPINQGPTERGMFGGGSKNAGSDTVRKAIAEAAADDSVEALLLRVDSPGGSAIASDIICEATKKFKESGRPYIVSMGNVAASGGYYVAAPADTIFADKGTITGSIGVVGGKIVTKGFWEWVGITGHEYHRGKHADIMNTNRKWDDEQREVITKMMYRVYDDFKGRVKEGRGERIQGDLEALAGGRVYSGQDALNIGLVDRLGGFAEAVKFAADEAELGGDYEVRVFPRPKSLGDIFGKLLGGEQKDDEWVSASSRSPIMGTLLAEMPGVAGALAAIGKVDPGKAQALHCFLNYVEMLTQESVLMADPTLNLIIK